jgi:transposase-like protein
MKTKLLCPFCGHDVFVRKTNDLVRLFDTGDVIVDEYFDASFDFYEYECRQCGKDITEEELTKEAV